MPRPAGGPLDYRALHQSALVGIRDYVCRAAPGGPESEEESTATSVVLMRHGTFSRHYGRRTVTTDVNQVAFFPKGSTYRVSHAADHGDRGTVFEVAPHVLSELLQELDPGAPEPAIPFDTGPCANEVFWRHRALVLRLENAAKEPLEAFEADATALQLVADVLDAGFLARGGERERPRPGTDAEHAERVEAARAYLAARMTERLTLEEVASAAAVSPFHLARLFRRRTGVPLHRYLTRLRLRASLERLAERGTEIAELAVDLGFASHSHFTDSFRREFGFPPSRLRGASAHRLRELSKNTEA